MIQFKSWRQYTHYVDGVRFPINIKEPFLIIYLPENTNLIEEYGKMNIRPNDIKVVTVPFTTIPRTRLTPDLIKMYRMVGLLPFTLKQKVPAGRNVILDLSNFTTALDDVLKPSNYRQRAGFLLKNTLLQSASAFPNNYQKILMYSVNVNNNVKPFIDRKIFPLIKDMKMGIDFPFDHFVLNVMSNNQPAYRLLIKEKDYKFQRVLNYLKSMKGIPTEEEAEEEVEKASNIIVKSVSSLIQPTNKGKIKGAVQTFLQKQPSTVSKILSGDVTADDVKDITTASILYKSSGELNRSKSLAQNISKVKKSDALRAVDKSIAKDLLQPEKANSLSTDPTVKNYSPEKMVEGKSPNHVYKKRQVDFETNLKNDLINSFKVLETKDVPLKIEDMVMVKKSGRPGEIEKSDIHIAKIKLTDNYGNTHIVSMELPKINPNTGVFRLNGRQKCLINQIVQNPITFPKPGASRFESSYSVFRIYVKTLRNVKYLESFMSYKMPLFYLLAFSFGFEETCKQYKINYEITDKRPNKSEKYFAKIKNDQYVVFKDVNTDVQKQLCVGLIHDGPDKYDVSKEFPTKDYFENLIIKLTGRMNSTFLISSNLQNIVDPVAKQVLMQKQLPTDLHLIMQYMAEKVVSGFHIERNDLSNQRIRNSEVLVHLAQKQILAAYTVYKEQVLSGNTEAKFEIPATKVLSDFLNTELVVDMEYANPIEEMSTMTRVSPVGKKVGGIPDKRAIHNTARNLHPSYFGNLDPLDTPEGGNIGIVQQLTVDALISSSRGLFSSKTINNNEKSGMLSTTACMVPFLENTDGARVIMLTNQAKQMLPLKNPQPPVVQSGYESILTGVLSDNFVKRAPCSGKVISVTSDSIKIKCADTEQIVDIAPVHLRSGSGKDTLSVFKPLVKPPQSVREGEVIADGACMSQGSISLGRPLLTALMPYKGYNFEDGAVISETVAKQDKLTSLHGIIEEVLISENDRLMYVAKIEEDIQKGQPLLRKTIGDIEDLIGFDDDETTDLLAGQFIKKSPGGRIVDIEVFSNIGDSKFPELKTLIQRTNKKYDKPPHDKFTIKGETIKGVLIRFKLEQELQVALGDKLCNRYGNKGIISLIEKDELMPRLPNGERLEVLFNPIGLIARMNIGQLYEMYCGLMARELGRRIPTMTNKLKIIDLIQSVYSKLDTSKNKKTTATLVANLNRLSPGQFSDLVNQVKTTGFYPIIIPPFMAPKHTDIGLALKVLGLQPSYNLFLPEFGIKTVKPVPVGYMYVCKLEHMADAKIYARGTGPTTGKTAQPTSGKRRDGGQRLGELDTYSFISYNCPATLAEFMGPLSDDYATKEEIISEIIQSGNAGYKEPKISPARDLLNSYFTSLMLTRD